MAAKRLRDEAEDRQDSDDLPKDKQMRTVPSISTVLREAVAARSLQSFTAALEPLLRRVVNEEVERGLAKGARQLQRSTSMKQIQVSETTTLQLIFGKPLSLPVFTGSKIEDEASNPLRIILVDARSGSLSPVSVPSAVRLEVVVLDGDFPGKQEDWTSAEFERNIVKERTGKRPLITGDVLPTLRDGSSTIGDLTFTDNSSWIRGRHFRLGVRVAPGSCPGGKIKEAMTEPFMVKDHRGELYKKHYPPSLSDEVWRLEKIGKEGVFHKRLRAAQINTVQELLKLWAVDEGQLRTILGTAMSDRMWEATLGHAKTCTMGSKLYLHRNPQCILLLNPICEIKEVIIEGQTYPPQSFYGRHQQDFLQQLVTEAYKHWDKLEEVDEMLGQPDLEQPSKVLSPIALPPSSSTSVMYQPTSRQDIGISTYQGGVFDFEVLQVESCGWIQNPDARVPQMISHVYNMSELSSEDEEDSNPSQCFSISV